MKSKFNFLIFAIIFVAGTSNIFAEKLITLDSIEVIKEFDNLYKSGDYYFGGQPTLEEIK